MYGYKGRILYVNLTSKKVEVTNVSDDFYGEYLGGSGVAAKIFLDHYKKGLTYDSEYNPIIIMTGPMAGTPTPSVSRFIISSLSPLTGIWGESNCGGFFASYLKFASFDGIVITGKSENPVYLFASKGKAEIRDASKLWGLDTYKTEEFLKKENGKDVEVISIGPAGENLVPYASVVNRRGHLAGRTGMGVVFGSKKLKAVVVQGNEPVQIAKPSKYKEYLKEIFEVYKENPTMAALKDSGSNSSYDLSLQTGDLPLRNWSKGVWPEGDLLGSVKYKDKILVGIETCYSCPVACKRVVEIKDGPYKIEKGPGPEYETVGEFGGMLQIADIEFIAYVNDIANRMGFDTITAGSTIAFLGDLHENGVIDKSFLHGVDLKFGDKDAVLQTVKSIADRTGIGELVSLGSERIANLIGEKAKDYITTVKGLEAPMHDPRGNFALALGYGLSVRGACHVSSLVFPVSSGFMYFPEIPELTDFGDPCSEKLKPELAVKAEDFGMFFNHSAIWCIFGGAALNATQVVTLFNLVTGFDYSLEDILKRGEKIWYLKRGVDNLFGIESKDDRLPKKLKTPLSEGFTQDLAPNDEKMLSKYYKLRDIDSITGKPSKEKLVSIGLSDLLQLLYEG
ncbi:MAG: aldehyde ferredoxin oxidoreductase family protein [Caldisericum sp.]|jgi:aldehyde:ferredoxin oxidoreductase|uniref:aldehyde ferredoxin oxidoreductase family protein n=1 Tax=Caldisericum sp. TaxID=2499687 RepID=UPI003D0BF0B4